MIGAGTGLGMAIVLPQNGQWRILASEGGHAAFAPSDEQQLALWSFLQARHGRVTWERVVSGPGLTAIHEFMSGTVLAPEEITSRALKLPDSAERRALDLFLAAYGAVAGDMALASLARGGVFLAGGIVTKLVPVLRGSGFLAAFNAKAEHAGIAARMPIHVATDPLLGLAWRDSACIRMNLDDCQQSVILQEQHWNGISPQSGGDIDGKHDQERGESAGQTCGTETGRSQAGKGKAGDPSQIIRQASRQGSGRAQSCQGCQVRQAHRRKTGAAFSGEESGASDAGSAQVLR